MSHTIENKQELIKRVRRIAGQVQGIERAIAGDADCARTLHLIAATRGAIGSLLAEVIEAHAREHVARPGLSSADRAQGVEELITALRRYAT
ncbi:metal/formaldehyde-sensitive transcriptional repressor [Bordetella sp. 2513F-2]